MNIKKARKIGFLAALTILVGSVVGVGIFFRNLGVSAINQGNGAGILLTWIFGGILALFAAISFSEIGSLETGKLQGFSGWAKRVGGSKFGNMVRVMYATFYFPVIVVAIGLFAAQFFLIFIHSAALATGAKNASSFASNNVPIFGQILIALAFIGLILLMQFFSTKSASFFQIITTFLKFIPIILIIVVGIILVNRNFITPENSFFGSSVTKSGINPDSPAFLSAPGKNGFTVGTTSAAGIFLALPGVLFSFDAFLIVASLTSKVKGEAKTVSKVVVLGLVIVIVFYTLVTLASILNNQGALQNVLINTLGVDKSLQLLVFFNLFLFISSIGVLNGLCFAIIGEVGNATSTDLIAGTHFLRSKKLSEDAIRRIFVALLLGFYMIVMYIPSIVFNSDKIVDGISTMPTVIFFILYFSVAVLYLINRKKFNETKKLNTIFLTTAVVIFSIGSAIAISGFYVNTIIQAVKNPFGDSGLGLFGPTGSLPQIANNAKAVISFFFTIFAFLTPVINFVVKLIAQKMRPQLAKKVLASS